MQFQIGQRPKQKNIVFQKGQFHSVGNYYKPYQLGEILKGKEK